MNIIEALEMQGHEKSVVSLVGGGGKTSIMFRVAEELKLLHKKLLVTTTTAIYNPGQALYDRLFLWNEKEKLNIEIQSPEKGSITVIGSHITGENKLKGIPVQWVDHLYGNNVYDHILVEADGAKKKPIKAPDLHEPVIPDCTSHLIGVIGFDCYGKNIDDNWVHRPHLLASVAEKELGGVIDAQVIIKLALSPMGLFKNSPHTARKVLFINKVENNDQYIVAVRIGNTILEQGTYIDKVLVGSLHRKEPVRTVMKRVT